MSKRKLLGDEDLAEYASLWQRSQKGLFKLEALQIYSPDLSPGWSEFERGDFATLKNLLRASLKSDPAYDLVKTRGVSFERIHIVELPLSEFMKYEIHSYLISEELGERIFLVSKDQVESKPLSAKPQDFLLFDDEVLILQNYDANGSYQSAELFEDEKDVAPYVNLRRELMAVATPLSAFVREHPQ